LGSGEKEYHRKKSNGQRRGHWLDPWE
jgi:hypothetical protein